MNANLAILPGDGVGPEVTAAAVGVLQAIADRFEHAFTFNEHLIGGCAIDATGEPLPQATRTACEQADAVLLGAVGGPKWSDPGAPVRPEQGLLGLRSALGVYANLRPVRVHPALAARSPLKNEKLVGVDFVVVRELTGGAYFGQKTRSATDASDECRYSEAEIERVLRHAFELARTRRGHLTSVDKANVLETSRLWRSTADRIARDYADVTLEHQLVDSMAMRLLTEPAHFDVVVTENLFGDILTDEAAALAGSLGLLPSASLGENRRGPSTGLRTGPSTELRTGPLTKFRTGPSTGLRTGLYEPIHGSAPDIAGQGIANPLGTIASAALLLRHSLGLEAEAAAVENAVQRVIEQGPLPRDIGGEADTKTVAAAVVAALDVSAPAREIA